MPSDNNPLEKYPKKKSNRSYGLFGYEAELVRQIIEADDEEAMKEVFRLGYVHAKSRTLYGFGLRDYCVDYGAKKCAAFIDAELSKQPEFSK
jgi:hypothetical protein